MRKLTSSWVRSLAEQATTVKIYDAALEAMKKTDYARARDLLEEMTHADLDEGTRQKVEDLLIRLRKDGAGKATLGGAEDAATVNAQRVQAEIGTKMGKARL